MNEKPEIMEQFTYAHLPASLARVSEPFCTLAELVVQSLPDCRERDKALDHLLYAKDAAVRAARVKPTPVGDKV